jgi:hypothetical protein
MTLSDLRLYLKGPGIVLLPPDDGSLELFVPHGVELDDEVAAAIREHKPVLMAWSARRCKCRWPSEWQERWGVVANELEVDSGLRFPQSEIRAFDIVLAEMQEAGIHVGAEG